MPFTYLCYAVHLPLLCRSFTFAMQAFNTLGKNDVLVLRMFSYVLGKQSIKDTD